MEYVHLGIGFLDDEPNDDESDAFPFFLISGHLFKRNPPNKDLILRSIFLFFFFYLSGLVITYFEEIGFQVFLWLKYN